MCEQTLGCRGHSFISSSASGIKTGTVSFFRRAVYLGAMGSMTYRNNKVYRNTDNSLGGGGGGGVARNNQCF